MFLKFIPLNLFLTYFAFAGSQSAVFTAGSTATSATFADTAPFTAAAAAGDWTITMRVPAFTAPAGGAYGDRVLFNLGSSKVWAAITTTSEVQFGVFDDVISGSPTNVAVSGDFILIIARSTSLNQYYFAVCPTDSSTCSEQTWSILSTGTGRFYQAAFGSINTALQAAFFRMKSGYDTTRPGEPDTPVANWLDYEFEGNLLDSSGNGKNLSVTSGSITYTTTPTYAPICDPGDFQVFDAGRGGELDGSGSLPLDGGATLSYFWQLVTGPVIPEFSSHATAQPTLTGFIFGQYDFTLKVTQGNGQSTTCTITHGAVANDINNVVVTGNSVADGVIGPIMRYGADTLWPTFDRLALAYADKFGAYQGSTYIDDWNTAAAGTITTTNGSATITGSGTAFQTLFCSGGTTPDSNTSLVVWYANSTASFSGLPGAPYGSPPTTGLGRSPVTIASCDTQTQITLSSPWSWTSTQSGVSYAKMEITLTNNWIGGSTNTNYYDNVLAFYTLYYRTGITAYRTYARWLADRWITMPYLDQGTYNIQPRLKGVAGMVLRAYADGQDFASGWDLARWEQALRNTVSYSRYDQVVRASVTNGTPFLDEREEAYQMQHMALCANYNFQSVGSACLADLSTAIDGRWSPRRTDGHWERLADGSLGSTNTLSTAEFPNSNTVTVTGSTVQCATLGCWTAGDVTTYPRFFGMGGQRVTLNDQTQYYTATYVDGDTLTLSRAYDGTTGVPQNWTMFTTYGGFGVQPFLLGVASNMLRYTTLAYTSAGDTARAASAATWGEDLATFVTTAGKGYVAGWKATGSLYNFAGVCLNVTSATTACIEPGIQEARVLNGEVVGPASNAYLTSSSPTLKSVMDTEFAAVFAFTSTDYLYDGIWVQALNDVGPSNDYWASNWAKWHGFIWGAGRMSSWPAARLGGVTPANLLTYNYVFTLPAGANKVQLTILRPDGSTVTPATCTTSPCPFTFDTRQGTHLVKATYLTSGNAVRYAGSYDQISQ